MTIMKVDNIIIILSKIVKMSKVIILMLKINNIGNRYVLRSMVNIIQWNRLFMKIMRKQNWKETTYK
jgi:hypothetical protein